MTGNWREKSTCREISPISWMRVNKIAHVRRKWSDTGAGLVMSNCRLEVNMIAILQGFFCDIAQEVKVIIT